ncbi:MAG: Bor family protein [Candidatus Cloacimonetes bacterium]|nr:Bor family protein [Candidatus Cloacimonadota bacterium]
MRKAMIILLAVAMLFVVSCSVNVHKVGKGAMGNEEVTARQWYIVAGLAPINEVDTNAMAGDATDYEITTQQTFIDGVISYFTSGLITCRTVTVKK